MEITDQASYTVVTCILKYASFEEAMSVARDDIVAHVKRSKELHAAGKLLLAGAFRNTQGGPLTTMAVTISPEAANEYLQGDPFYIKGMIAEWHIREWANMFAS